MVVVVALLAGVFETLVSQMRSVLRQFLVDSYLQYFRTKNTHDSTAYLSGGMLLRHWRTENAFTSNSSDDS